MRPHALWLGAFVIPLQLGAQERLPILDMHLHALPADNQGPPPLAICVPFDPFPAWDPARPFGATFMAIAKRPTCEDPGGDREASRAVTPLRLLCASAYQSENAPTTPQWLRRLA